MKSTIVIEAIAVAVLCLMEFRVLGLETMPEGVVWTEPHAVFWEGQYMVNLTCRFQGQPLVVSWSKDDSAEDLITWANGGRDGRRFRDGSLSLTDDYSLVFKQPIIFEDAGRYICRVHFSTTRSTHNSTTVTVRELQIQTTQKLTVWHRETASLPCELPYTPFRVHWLNASNGEWVASYTNDTFSTPDDGNGRSSMEKDFSLTIGDVSVLNEATLTCEVFTFDSRSWKNSTELIVNAYGEGPSFDGCQGSEYCDREVNSREFQLSCSVRGAKPDVNISLRAAGNSNLTLLSTFFERREDGTRDQTIIANVLMSSETSVETFTCLASGVAAGGTRSATKTVIVKSETVSTTELITSFISILLIAITTIILGAKCLSVYCVRGYVEDGDRNFHVSCNTCGVHGRNNATTDEDYGDVNQSDATEKPPIEKMMCERGDEKDIELTTEVTINKANQGSCGVLQPRPSESDCLVLSDPTVNQSDATEGLTIQKMMCEREDATDIELTIDKTNQGSCNVLQPRSSESDSLVLSDPTL